MKNYKIIAVIDATFAVAKRKPEKLQDCTGICNRKPRLRNK